jgi:hypothetical protein
MWARHRPDSVEFRVGEQFMLTSVLARGFGACIGEGSCPRRTKFRGTPNIWRCSAFHQILCVVTSFRFIVQQRLCRFCSGAQLYSCPRFHGSPFLLSCERKMSGPSSEIEFISILANLMAISEVSCPTHKNYSQNMLLKLSINLLLVLYDNYSIKLLFYSMFFHVN